MESLEKFSVDKPGYIAKGAMHMLHPQGLTYNRIHRAKCELTTRAENSHA